MKKIVAKIKEISWKEDAISFAKDLVYFLRDTINDASHLIARGIKLVTLVSIWSKELSFLIEELLHSLRNKLGMKK